MKSGETLRRVVDLDTLVPGAPSQSFTDLGTPQINDAGDIVFAANLNPGPMQRGMFLVSKGSLRLLLPDSGGSRALNHSEDLNAVGFRPVEDEYPLEA